MTPLRFLLLVVLLAGAARPIAAHEGDEHAAESVPAARPAGDTNGTQSRVAESAAHELLFRAGEIEPAHRSMVHLFLSELDTNAPITGARLEVSSSAHDSAWNAKAESPGVYVADIAIPAAGTYTLDVVVRHGEEVDLLSIDSVRVGVAPPGAGIAASAGGGGLPPWAFAAFAGFGVLAIASLALFARARARARGGRRPRPGGVLSLVVALSVAALLAHGAIAHEGEVHGENEAEPERNEHALHAAAGRAAVPAGARYMAKEAQFDLGLLTAVARVDSLSETRRAFGTVVADPSAAADVVAPQTGRFVGRRAWRIGDRVARGQALGAVLVVDELPVRTPIRGTITAISAVPGQTVAAGQAIARVTDLDRVRVEVSLYGEALSAASRARSAVVRLPALPGRVLEARVEGLAPASDGGPSVPLVLDVRGGGDVLRPGMVVEAELRLPGATPSIVVPASAVLSTERGPVVFVKVGAEAFAQRAVTLGPSAGDRVAVTSGVADGERVVVSAAAPLLSTPEETR
jgi:multidrug efflux pump subunit AcrA (membrane-fusion protein)